MTTNDQDVLRAERDYRGASRDSLLMVISNLRRRLAEARANEESAVGMIAEIDALLDAAGIPESGERHRKSRNYWGPKERVAEVLRRLAEAQARIKALEAVASGVRKAVALGLPPHIQIGMEQLLAALDKPQAEERRDIIDRIHTAGSDEEWRDAVEALDKFDKPAQAVSLDARVVGVVIPVTNAEPAQHGLPSATEDGHA